MAYTWSPQINKIFDLEVTEPVGVELVCIGSEDNPLRQAWPQTVVPGPARHSCSMLVSLPTVTGDSESSDRGRRVEGQHSFLV